jgi:hypothetical protein
MAILVWLTTFLMDLTWYYSYIVVALWWFSEWIWNGISVVL